MQVKYKNLTYKVTLWTKINVCSCEVILKIKRMKRNLKGFCFFLINNKINLITLIFYIFYFIGLFCYNYYKANLEELSIIKIGIQSFRESSSPFLFTVVVPFISNLTIFYTDKRRKLRERYNTIIHVEPIIEECLEKMYPLIKAELPEGQSLFRKLYEYRNKGWETKSEYILNGNSKVYVVKLLSCLKHMENALDNDYEQLLLKISRGDIIKAEGLSFYVFYSENELEYSRYMLEYRGEFGIVNYLYDMLELLKEPWNNDKKLNMRIKKLLETDKIIQANKLKIF